MLLSEGLLILAVRRDQCPPLMAVLPNGLVSLLPRWEAFNFTAVRILQHPAEAGDIQIGLAGSGITTHLKARNILCVGKAFEEIQ